MVGVLIISLPLLFRFKGQAVGPLIPSKSFDAGW